MKSEIKHRWPKSGVISSQILYGDLYKTHLNLQKLFCLAELGKIIVSSDQLSISIPKENPLCMISKVFWLTSILAADRVQVIKKGTRLKSAVGSYISFNECCEIMSIYGIHYKSIDSRQKN